MHQRRFSWSVGTRFAPQRDFAKTCAANLSDDNFSSLNCMRHSFEVFLSYQDFDPSSRNTRHAPLTLSAELRRTDSLITRYTLFETCHRDWNTRMPIEAPLREHPGKG